MPLVLGSLPTAPLSSLHLAFCRIDWNTAHQTRSNYKRIGVILNPNAGFGRNKKDDISVEDVQVVEGKKLDGDVTRLLGQATEKVPPKPPTSRQRNIIDRLIAAHEDDLESMVSDRKLNPMQHSQGELRRLIQAVQYYPEGSAVKFRAPNKRL